MRILSIILLSLSGVVYSQSSDVIDGIIGVVGDNIILHSEVEAQLVQAKRDDIELGENPKCTIFQELLFNALLVNQAKLDSVVVSEDQVNAELENRIRFFEQQIGGREKLEEFYGKTIAEIKDEFYKLIESRMLADQMKSTISKDIAITPKEVKRFYKSIPEDSIPLVGSKVEVAHIIKQPQVSQSIKDETKKKLEQYRQDILKGERTFATTAVLYSKDPGTRSNGGEFGWVDRGTFVPEFDRVAFSMKEGEISEVFETNYGFHILELFERRGDQYSGRHVLLIPETSLEDLKKAELFLDSVYDVIKSGSITFAEAAAKFSDDKETKNMGGTIYNQNTATSKFEMSELDKQLFVVIDKLEVGEISKPAFMQTQDGKAYRLVMLKSISEPHKANLTDDYQLINNMALQEKKQKAMETWIQDKASNTYIEVSGDYKDCEVITKWIQ